MAHFLGYIQKWISFLVQFTTLDILLGNAATIATLDSLFVYFFCIILSSRCVIFLILKGSIFGIKGFPRLSFLIIIYLFVDLGLNFGWNQLEPVVCSLKLIQGCDISTRWRRTAWLRFDPIQILI